MIITGVIIISAFIRKVGENWRPWLCGKLTGGADWVFTSVAFVSHLLQPHDICQWSILYYEDYWNE